MAKSPPISAAREEALRRLKRIDEGAYIGLEGLDADMLEARDARLAMEYVAGVTRWRRRLDHILQHYYRGDFENLEPDLKQILRIGLYEILFLSTPDYAAVNENVELAKQRIRAGAGGLVNGVLRSVVRNLDDLPQPATGDPAEDMGILHSHPTWLVRRWVDRYGADTTKALLEWNNTRPVYGVRVNTLKISVDDFLRRLTELDVGWEPGNYIDYFVRVQNVQPLLEAGLLRDGYCAVQDEAAGLLVTLMDPMPGETVLDMCAAPGGKAIHAAQEMRNEGRVVAADVHPARLRLVRRAAEQQGASIVELRQADARELKPNDVTADRVLVDAPCSGTGVLSKRADLRWKRAPEDLDGLIRLQEEILETAAALVAPGGILVYGTCSIEPDENEERVREFLARHPEFELEEARDFVPVELTDASGLYRTFPPRDGVDGAFGARMRRKS